FARSRAAGSDDSVQLAAHVRDVELAVRVFGEGGNIQSGLEAFVHVQRGLGIARYVPDASAHEVGEQITANEAWNGGAAVHVSAGDGLAQLVGVLSDRREQRADRCAARVVERFAAFEATPAVIATAHHAVHFLDVRFAHVAQPEIAGLAIEAPAPWIAQAPGP